MRFQDEWNSGRSGNMVMTMNYSVTSWFGILYRYSSTSDRLLWFDEISIDGIFYKDAVAPEITGCKLQEEIQLRLVYQNHLLMI